MARGGKTAKKGVRGRVRFVGWCKQAECDWSGPPRDRKQEAARDVAWHEMDHHGGAWRAESGFGMG